MRKVTDFLVNHCYVIFVVFLICTAICGVLSTKVTINKDIYSYMPADSETSLGLNIMNDEFDYDKSSSYEMMLTDVPQDKKMSIKSDIEAIEGVESAQPDHEKNICTVTLSGDVSLETLKNAVEEQGYKVV